MPKAAGSNLVAVFYFFFGISLPNIVFTSVRFCNKLGLSLLVGFSRKLGFGLGLGSVSQ